MRNKIK